MGLTNRDIEDAVTAARQLGYSMELREKIKHAKTQVELSNLMAQGRHELDDWDKIDDFRHKMKDVIRRK